MKVDECFKMIDGVLARLEIQRQDHVNLASSLGYLYEMAKEAEENRQVMKDGGTNEQSECK